MAPPSAIEPSMSDTHVATLTGPLTVNGVPARRAKSVKIAGGIAAHASSEMFKSPGHGKPKAKRWDHRLNEESKSRKGSTLKGAAKYLKQPDLISLGGGLPSSEYFPFEQLQIKVPTPPHFSEEETKTTGMTATAGKHDIEEGKSLFDIHVAFNYGQSTGSAQLLRFVTEHTEIVHNPPYQDWQCTLTVGSTSALDMALRMFTTRGTCILTEEYTFATAVETAAPMGVHAVGIKMDEQGLLPSHMNDVLNDWDPAEHNGAPKPWLLYTVPSGQNPTGATQSLRRRKELYRCAQKHDVYILEDEPYFFLQMDPYTGPNAPDVSPPASHEEFIKALVPSLLSMDVDARVMRMDSFSKVLAPGSRVGWITASEQIVERFVRHHEVSTQNPSGISQLVLFKLLDESWGHAGYLDWLMALRLAYTKRRDVICYACERYLPKEVASWNAPAAGMFHWIKINWRLHPSASEKGLLAIEDEIFHAGIDRGVLSSKGSWFRAGGTAAAQTESAEPDAELFFRFTFAAAPPEKITEAIRRFGEGLRAVFGLESNGVK
ncbi:Aromatic/aminoadipate aminotransferase 1 [Bachmanniomyces sp. S44760]|nr:Aromatic/aminoadipate aminotransferase 1 [Bachmanniomyces sp. S44760]